MNTKRVIEVSQGAAVALADNAQGARLLVGRLERKVMEDAVTVARTKAEARQLITVLRDLMQDLPEEAPVAAPGEAEARAWAEAAAVGPLV